MEAMSKQQRIIVSLLLAVGGGMLVLAALTASGSDNDVTVTRSSRDRRDLSRT